MHLLWLTRHLHCCLPTGVGDPLDVNQSIWTWLYETFRGVSRAEFGLK
jgi:hypothetical protein